jgi:hypothetical protein
VKGKILRRLHYGWSCEIEPVFQNRIVIVTLLRSKKAQQSCGLFNSADGSIAHENGGVISDNRQQLAVVLSSLAEYTDMVRSTHQKQKMTEAST